MPNEEVRKANALAGIERHLKDLVQIMTAVNQNLVTFAKIVQTSKDETDSDVVKLFTLEEWQNHLHRHWNYNLIGNMGETKLTEVEFLDYMARNGTEITHQIPPEKR